MTMAKIEYDCFHLVVHSRSSLSVSKAFDRIIPDGPTIDFPTCIRTGMRDDVVCFHIGVLESSAAVIIHHLHVHA